MNYSREPVTVVGECDNGDWVALTESGRLVVGPSNAMSQLDFGGSVLLTLNNESTYFTEEGDFVVDKSDYERTTATWQGRSVDLHSAEDFVVEEDNGVFRLTLNVVDYSI